MFNFIELGAQSLHARQNQDALLRARNFRGPRRVRRPAVLARVRASCLGSSHKIGTGPQARRGYGATIDAHGLTQYPRQAQEASVSRTRVNIGSRTFALSRASESACSTTSRRGSEGAR